VVGVEDNGEVFQPKGWALLFHPDLIRGTSLGRNIGRYTFFSYESYEALHLSEQERHVVIDCLQNIAGELQHAIDKHSRTLIVSNIELLLNYSVRFYERQFTTRSDVNKDALSGFERLLSDYFRDDAPQRDGVPSVRWCAEQLHLSANYFGDLVKKETGKSAQEYIQLKVIDIAKERMFDTTKSISEIAYELGFRYPQHFTRLFKKCVGQSPNEYRHTFSVCGDFRTRCGSLCFVRGRNCVLSGLIVPGELFCRPVFTVFPGPAPRPAPNHPGRRPAGSNSHSGTRAASCDRRAMPQPFLP